MWRNQWFVLTVVTAAAGHAMLAQAVLGARPPWAAALVMAPFLCVALGEWLAEDATAAWLVASGHGLCAVGAVVHLALDAACLALPWIGGPTGSQGCAFALVAVPGMSVVLADAIARLRGREPPRWAPTADSRLGRLWREATLVGGNAITLVVIGVGLTVAVLAAIAARPTRPWWPIAVCTAMIPLGAWMGLERRALLLGRPFGLPWLRRLRRRGGVYLATRDGLVRVDPRGATLYRWIDLAQIDAGTVSENPCVIVVLAADAAPERTDDLDPDRALERERRDRGWTRTLFGCDLAILAAATEHGPGPLLLHLARALADPAAREALPTAAAEVRRVRET